MRGKHMAEPLQGPLFSAYFCSRVSTITLQQPGFLLADLSGDAAPPGSAAVKFVRRTCPNIYVVRAIPSSTG